MAQEMTLVLEERDAMGQKRELWFTSEKQLQIFANNDYTSHRTKNQDIKEFLKKVFLPAGYPKTVTPDYLQYQILNAAQAFCNSLAGLLASRAVLEGIGVGSSSATATQAMLLSVLRDAFGRITTIVGAYYLGTSLVSEAKLYRFLADVLNDIPLILDLLTPVLSTSFFPGASTLGLCTSAALRALCGIVAGGSKTAITLHFATPTTGLGDLGDLNAKDSSKETVLALVGMLLGSLIVPFITSTWATYTFLLLLVALHLAINYYAVRGIALRQLNKQRAAIAWLHYKANKKAPTPQQVAEQESIFDLPGIIRDPSTHRIIGQFHMGSAPLDVLRGTSLSSSFLKIFEGQKYIVCFDPHTSSPNVVHHSDSYPIVHVCFHENFTAEDQLEGWIHAVEICRLIASKKSFKFTDPRLRWS
ncbi:hypothetical protein D9756_008203 [Leucocoprinus leucothites]|uniref:Protein root UVB sensitive/RUS domain-containing protein n=1 Tax=Leucocoprinus leucothites TaxID=201217 RepID=A0A8H5CZX4_9AGAR|nr:hypothetical protein D9756_008203 [Leucoagaricus leucothites]